MAYLVVTLLCGLVLAWILGRAAGRNAAVLEEMKRERSRLEAAADRLRQETAVGVGVLEVARRFGYSPAELVEAVRRLEAGGPPGARA